MASSASWRMCRLARRLPNFSLPDTAGVAVSLSDFEVNMYYLISGFLVSSCRRENPNVVKAFQDYKDKNFTIIGISLDNNKDKWLKAIADDNPDLDTRLRFEVLGFGDTCLVWCPRYSGKRIAQS